MNTKKLLAILLAAVMMLTVVACGEDDPASGTKTNPVPAKTTENVTNDVTNGGTKNATADDTKNAVVTSGGEVKTVFDMFTFMDEAPSVAYVGWTFSGLFTKGAMATEEQVNAILTQMDYTYQYVFDDETMVTLFEGADTITEGSYTVSGDSVSMEIGNMKYNAKFIEGDYAPVMVIIMDNGANALFFDMIVEG